MADLADNSDFINHIKELCNPHNEMSSWHLSDELFNLPRSVSGQANLETLETLKNFFGNIPFKIKSFSKNNYYSWSKPNLWSYKNASIKSPD